MATVTLDQQNTIVNLYVALFNRAPDADGFAFWTQALANGASLPTVTGAFFVSPEATTTYPASQTAEQFVSAFYRTVFGRTADAEGLAFWTGVLESAGGIGSEAAKALLVSKIVDIVSAALDVKPADLTDAQYAETLRDRAIFSKKNLAATDFVIDQKGTDLEAARQALLDALAPAPTPTPANQTFTLTTGDDAPVGGAGNDTFNALSTDGSNTLNDSDVLDGGAGRDTLNVELNTCTYTTPTLRSIEVVNVRALGYSILELDPAAGIREVNVANSENRAVIDNVGDAALSVAHQTEDVYFSGSTAANLSLTLTDVADLDLDLAANGEGAKATTHNIVMTDSSASIVESVKSAAVVAIKLTLTGSNSLLLSTDDTATVEKITVTGTGNIQFGYTALTAITDFTGAGGGVQLQTDTQTPDSLTIDTGAGTGADIIGANGASIKLLNLNAGNDNLRVIGSLSATAVVQLGAGDDDLNLETGSREGATVDAGDGDDIIYLGPITHAVAGVREVVTMTEWTGLAANDSFSVGGLTFTAGSSAVTSAQLLDAFANLADGATAGTSQLGNYSGVLTGYATGAATDDVVSFTATNAGDTEDLRAGGTSPNAVPIEVTTQGVTAVAGSVDTLTGGAGADTFLFFTPIVATTAGQVTVVITDFATGVDKLNIFSTAGNWGGSANSLIRAGESASLEDLLIDATAKLADKVYYLGQVGEDSYLVTGYLSQAYTHVIKLAGIAPGEFADTDIVGGEFNPV